MKSLLTFCCFALLLSTMMICWCATSVVYGDVRNPAPLVNSHTRGTTDRTLVSWFAFDENAFEYGGVVSIQAGDDVYDAIAFDFQTKRWYIASEDGNRSQDEEARKNNPEEEIVAGKFIQMAAVFQGNTITIYRNGEVYTKYTIDPQNNKYDTVRSPFLTISIGPTHLSPKRVEKGVRGQCDDVRVYDQALTQQQVKDLKLDDISQSGLQPFAWWNFEQDPPGYMDVGHKFPESRVFVRAKIEDGTLTLLEFPSYIWTGDCAAVRYSRDLREHFMEDPIRPTYHLINVEGDNKRKWSVDPNITRYWKGKYHLVATAAARLPGPRRLPKVTD